VLDSASPVLAAHGCNPAKDTDVSAHPLESHRVIESIPHTETFRGVEIYSVVPVAGLRPGGSDLHGFLLENRAAATLSERRPVPGADPTCAGDVGLGPVCQPL
jgi:hypothetical protein